MVIRLSNDIGHRLWLQGPFNHLGSERKANYIAKVLRRILEFLHVSKLLKLEPFIIIFLYKLVVCCCCWRNPSLWIDDQIG